jgi:hypothetical protein
MLMWLCITSRRSDNLLFVGRQMPTRGPRLVFHRVPDLLPYGQSPTVHMLLQKITYSFLSLFYETSNPL